MVEDGAFSHKIDFISFFLKDILNIQGHPNRFIGSKLMFMLVNRGISLSGGVALGRFCACSLRRRLVLIRIGCMPKISETLAKKS